MAPCGQNSCLSMLHMCGARIILQILFMLVFQILGNRCIPFYSTLVFIFMAFVQNEACQFLKWLVTKRCRGLFWKQGAWHLWKCLWLLTESSDQESCSGLFEFQSWDGEEERDKRNDLLWMCTRGQFGRMLIEEIFADTAYSTSFIMGRSWLEIYRLHG